jgi:hypothetical protein
VRWLPPILARVAAFADVDRAIRSLSERISQITGVGIINGRLVEEQALTTAFTTITHGLGRMPKGVLVVKNDLTATLSLIRTQEFTSTTFDIRSYSGSITVSLWIF